MKERRIVVGACAVGALSIVGLALLSKGRRELAPRVLATRLAPSKDGPSFFVVDVAPALGLLELAREGDEACEYRVRDATGREYPLLPTCDERARRLRVLYAYGRAPVRPEIEVWVNGARRASVPVDLPPPPQVNARLVPERGASVRAFRVPIGAGSGGDAHDDLRQDLRLAPRRPMPPDERWEVAVRGTSVQPGLRPAPNEDTTATLGARLAGDSVGAAASRETVSLFYGDDVEALRLRVRRIAARKETRRVMLSLRLVRRKGQTALVLDGPVPQVPGCVLTFRPDETAPSGSAVQEGGDRRAPRLGLVATVPAPIVGVHVASPDAPFTGLAGGSPPTFFRASPHEARPVRLDQTFRVARIEGAALGGLNLRSLSIGDATWTPKAPPRGAVDPRPFRVALTLERSWDAALGAFEATIPVEPAATR